MPATTFIDIPLREARIQFNPHWLDAAEADHAFAELRRSIAWETHRIRLFGRELDAPRLSCWIGDPGASYTYSRTRFEPHVWTTTLAMLRDRLQRELRADFNSVLANLYRDGRDSMGWHSDDERELGVEPVIASLSLGAARRFVLRHRRNPDSKLALDLPHGSLLLMRGQTQRHWRHALPRTAKPVGERINLTFRLVRA